MVTRTSDPLEMRVWYMPIGTIPRPEEVIGEVGENIEWIVEEGDNVFYL